MGGGYTVIMITLGPFTPKSGPGPYSAQLRFGRHLCIYISFFLTNKPSWGGRMACWLEHWTRDWKVASSNPGRSGRRIFFPCQLSVLTLTWCPFHHHVTAVARKRPRALSQRCRWQVAPKHMYTLEPMKSEWAQASHLSFLLFCLFQIHTLAYFSFQESNKLLLSPVCVCMNCNSVNSLLPILTSFLTHDPE